MRVCKAGARPVSLWRFTGVAIDSGALYPVLTFVALVTQAEINFAAYTMADVVRALNLSSALQLDLIIVY